MRRKHRPRTKLSVPPKFQTTRTNFFHNVKLFTEDRRPSKTTWTKLTHSYAPQHESTNTWTETQRRHSIVFTIPSHAGPPPYSSCRTSSALSGVHRHSDKHATGKIPKAQCAFKILMIHEVLQFALRIAFRCVLHRCGNLDIHR